MSQHTPGPWKILRSRAGKPKITDSGTYLIASTVCGGNRGGREAGEFNACLIAAAPDLLHALKEACDVIEDTQWEGEDRARSAIAKAEGLSR
jgi:hypothetical protein